MKALLLLLLVAGCSRAPEAPKGFAVYESKKGDFSIYAPEDWRVMEDQGGTHRVSVFGPPPNVEMISVYRHDGGDLKAYMAGRGLGAKMSTSPRKNEFWLVRDTLPMHGRPSQEMYEYTVVFPDDKGFWSLVHAAPNGLQSDKVFEQARKSFSDSIAKKR